MTAATLLLSTALRHANDAVAADHGGNYAHALRLYEDCVQALESDELLLSLTAEVDRLRVADMVVEYQDRMELILTEVPDLLTTTKQLIPDWSLDPVDADAVPLFGQELEPSMAELKPYWLLRRLQRTVHGTGAYLTEHLFAPSDLWQQQGVKFVALDVKYTTCDNLLLWLQKVKELDVADCEALSKELDLFEEQLIVTQNALARKLAYIEEYRMGASSAVSTGQGGASSAAAASPGRRTAVDNMSKKIERLSINTCREKGDSGTAYIRLVFRIIDTCLFLDDWVRHFARLPATPIVWCIQNQLARVSEFMQSVFCGMIIADLRLLLRTYIQRQREEMMAY